MTKKIKATFALLTLCSAFAVIPSLGTKPSIGKVWLGITYIISKEGYSAEASTAVGAIGIMDAAAWGFAVGSIGTPVAGAIAGAVSGF